MLTKKLLEQMGACTTAIEFCRQYNLFGLPLVIFDKIEGDHLHYKKWFTDRKFELLDGNVSRIENSNGYWETFEYLAGLVIRSDDSYGLYETIEYWPNGQLKQISGMYIPSWDH